MHFLFKRILILLVHESLDTQFWSFLKRFVLYFANCQLAINRKFRELDGENLISFMDGKGYIIMTPDVKLGKI